MKQPKHEEQGVSWNIQMLISLDGKTPMERFRIVQEHVKKCREAFDRAQSDLIEAERLMADVSREYMNEYFPANRK